MTSTATKTATVITLKTYLYVPWSAAASLTLGEADGENHERAENGDIIETQYVIIEVNSKDPTERYAHSPD
jgi:hypothetical protein